jgi:uracil DNA glycosylase
MLQVTINNTDEVIGRLLERLKSSGWDSLLELIIDSSMFRSILETLVEDVEKRNIFYPKVAHWFRAFEECPMKKTRCIWIASLPSKYHSCATGIPYNTTDLRKSIIGESFEREIRKTFNDSAYNVPKDFTDWTRQGLLMLPCAFTNGHGRDHIELWKPFMSEVCDMLMHRFPDVPWVLLGRSGKWFEDWVKGEMLHRQHPLNSRNVPWKGDNLFKEINNILLRQGKDDFIW